MMSATYSPEDNKLRLYASSRLDAETYARVKAAGFSWAPKQDLFVAPMWTPSREDLLIELAGEIDDEDKSLVDRAEERAERFEDYRDSRAADAESARQAVSRIADGIPLGQPILIGHHSERHARKDAERIENGMRKAVQMWRTSEYWKDRARGAIRHAKYKERPDVRARRIKKLEAEKRREERTIAHAEKFAAAWNTRRDQQDAGTWELTKEMAERIANFDGGYWRARFEHPSGYVGPCSLWSALRDGFATVIEVRDAALRGHAATIEHARRWLEHFENRLAYERAMLDDAGGTVADRTGPEVGGGCKTWASPRGGWSYIVKVNRQSITLYDNWGNGGKNFTRTIPFDKLAAVMSKADVDAARAEDRIVESGDVLGFLLLTDRPKPPTPPVPDDADAKPFEAMAQTLRAGVKVVSAPQLFPTPDSIARQLAGLADICPARLTILEPSAGTGALLDKLRHAPHARIVAVEINHQLAALLSERYPGVEVRCADFLSLDPAELGQFDRVVMNPPFRQGEDIKHIEHARRFLKPGGRLVSVCANGPRQREALEPIAEDLIDLPPGSFAEQGTNVNAAIVVIKGEESDCTAAANTPETSRGEGQALLF